MNGLTVDHQPTLARHPTRLPDLREPDGGTHGRPAGVRQNTMVLGQRDLLSVLERQPVHRLNALVDHVADVTGRELASLLVQDTNSHPTDARTRAARAVPAGEARPNASPADLKLTRDRALASTVGRHRPDLASLLLGQCVAVPLPNVPQVGELVDGLAHVRVAVDVDERDLRVACEAADAMSEPLAGDEDRAAVWEREGVGFEGGP